MSYLLVDIGGTHIRFACCKQGHITNTICLKVADYPDIESALHTYQNHIQQALPVTWLFSVASPVIGQDVFTFQNNHWRFSRQKLQATWQVSHFEIMNDICALAYGVKEHVTHKGTSIIIGVGTGLGVSLIWYDQIKGIFAVIPSELGHLPAILPTGRAHWEAIIAGKAQPTKAQFITGLAHFIAMLTATLQPVAHIFLAGGMVEAMLKESTSSLFAEIEKVKRDYISAPQFIALALMEDPFLALKGLAVYAEQTLDIR